MGMLDRRLVTGILLVLALAGCAGVIQQVSVDDIIRLSGAGLSDAVIIARLEREGRPSVVGAADIARMRDAGVSEAIITQVAGERYPGAPDSSGTSQILQRTARENARYPIFLYLDPFAYGPVFRLGDDGPVYRWSSNLGRYVRESPGVMRPEDDPGNMNLYPDRK